MADVIGLDGKPVEVDIPYNLSMAEYVEATLNEVKNNQITAIAIAFVRTDGSVESRMQGNPMKIICALARALHRANLAADEESVVVQPEPPELA